MGPKVSRFRKRVVTGGGSRGGFVVPPLYRSGMFSSVTHKETRGRLTVHRAARITSSVILRYGLVQYQAPSVRLQLRNARLSGSASRVRPHCSGDSLQWRRERAAARSVVPRAANGWGDMRIPFTAYFRDGRGNRLEDYEIVRGPASAPAVLIRGPVEVIQQLALLSPECVIAVAPASSHWTHRVTVPAGITTEHTELLDLLKKVLILATPQHVDVALALDWYKDTSSADDPNQWKNTNAGEFIYRLKYWSLTAADRSKYLNGLVGWMSTVIGRHPLYRDALNIVSMPGSKPEVVSFGETFAQAVAIASGKTYIRATGSERPPAKEAGYSATIDQTFQLPHVISGSAILLDDVFRTGGTMRATAVAARRAGAAKVYGIVCARTMRS